MAIAQRQHPYAFPNPRTRGRARSHRHQSADRRNLRAYSPYYMVAILLVTGLIMYIQGCSLMASAGIEKNKLHGKLKNAQMQKQVINAQLLDLRNKENVEAWALKHNMQRAQGIALVLGVQKGKQ